MKQKQAINSIAWGNVLKNLRTSKRMKQKELSEITNIPVTVLSKLENDKIEPGTKHLKKLAKAFNMPVQLLMLMTLDEKDIAPQKQNDFKQLSNLIKDLFG